MASTVEHKQNGIVMRNPLKAAATDLLADIFTHVNVRGRENLEHALALRDSGLHSLAIIAGKHSSTGDKTVLNKALRTAGHADIVPETTTIVGTRFWKHAFIRQLLDSESYIPVWPQTETPQNDEEINEKNRLGFQSFHAVNEVWKQKGVVVFYPEGTRRHKQLGPGVPQVAHYLLRKDVITLPVGMSGMEKVMPVGAVMPKRGVVNVNFGEPFSLYEIMQQEKLSKKDRQALVDLAMRRIAVLLPENARGYYGHKYYDHQNQTN